MQRIKGVQSIIVVAVIEGCHYNGGAIPLQQLNELRICHAFKLTGRKVPDASESLWFVFMPNEYLQNRGCKPQWRLSKGGGGKSFYGELKEDGTFYVLAIACLMRWHFMVCCLCSISKSSDIPLKKKLIIVSTKALNLSFFRPIPWILWV